MEKNFTISLDNVLHGRVHTMITSAFSHAELGHMTSNMIGLCLLGLTVGDILGPGYLVKLYLAGAIGGSVLHLVHHAFLALRSKGQVMWKDPSRTPALGAIGAVNALIWLYIFPILEAAIYLEFSSIPVRVMLLGAFLIGKDMLLIINGNGNISGAAYLGGVLVGALACARIRKGHF
ncbi:RHOMBOID-like protein 12, mitochondrial isoform X3 [Mangifera indica]|nr:RHOMBOID-like protein 12, mitochondrial isoform X3 [Mangifera indica]XP_044484636.1 RHOMBOID-like protein 12, mitochondrial isoform X3 [Mangifera indica]XP_044484637.1 RHOMBOID-like protein 12, mitochondrial isoform X3 [Mangifera indica]